MKLKEFEFKELPSKLIINPYIYDVPGMHTNEEKILMGIIADEFIPKKYCMLRIVDGDKIYEGSISEVLKKIPLSYADREIEETEYLDIWECFIIYLKPEVSMGIEK